jgi:hypothetical protein
MIYPVFRQTSFLPTTYAIANFQRYLPRLFKAKRKMPYRFILLFVFGLSAALLSAQASRKIKLNPVSLGFDLPQSYKERTFIKGLAGFVNNIDQLVGAMILIEDNKTSVLTRFVRQDKPPVVSTSTSDVIYSAKIDSKFKFNGAYCIASTKVEKDNIYELIIKDVAVAFLPEDYIPYLEICKSSSNVPPETKKKTYYLRSAKLTTVYTRAYQKAGASSEIRGMAFSAGGEVYSSTDQFKVDYIVSVDLVGMEKLLSLQNCNQLLNSEELARREKAEKARMEASRAEEERKARENELREARAQVEDLKTILTHNIERSENLQQQLREAQEREAAALTQLNQAISQAEELSSKAQFEQRNAENREVVIVTFKNKDGKALEIKSLEELSPEKLRELGFDMEILKERR